MDLAASDKQLLDMLRMPPALEIYMYYRNSLQTQRLTEAGAPGENHHGSGVKVGRTTDL